MKISRICTMLLLIITFFWAPTQQLFSQKAEYGNKTITKDKRLVSTFTRINIGINGKIIIHSGEQPHVIVETDENLQEYISTKVKLGVLKIEQLKWPEPSKGFTVHVYAPMITKIESDSWANVLIEDIDQDKLTILTELGSIIASGSVEKLIVKSKQAKIDFSQLTVEEADIVLTGYANMKLCCAESLKTRIDSKARLRVISNEDEEPPEMEKPVYINFVIRNNQMNRNHFVVQGPGSHPFSYGFPMLPFATKKERWPIGTKIYKENSIGIKKILVEITAEDEGKKVDLIK